MNEVTLEDIRAAARRIANIAHRTPVMTSRTFNALVGAEVFFKCENFQRGGAFKIRGATNFVFSIPPADLPRGVVTYSSGNHAQAVAIAAAAAGVPATIVMPSDAPRAKIEATRGYGARVVTYNRAEEDREAIGRKIAQETGATLAPPYDHPWTIAGQGTVALELLDEVPDLDAMVVCVGGGGLLAGCSIAARALSASIRIFGAEPEAASDTYQSFRAGHRVEIPMPVTSADGLMSTAPGALTFPVIQRLVEDILLAGEEDIRRAVKFLLTRMKILVEPSGAVTTAVMMAGKLPAGCKRVGAVISGGNVDLDFLQSLRD